MVGPHEQNVAEFLLTTTIVQDIPVLIADCFHPCVISFFIFFLFSLSSSLPRKRYVVEYLLCFIVT